MKEHGSKDSRPDWLKSQQAEGTQIGQVKVDGKEYQFTLVKAGREPRLPYETGFPSDGALFISENVPEEYRDFILAHEVREKTRVMNIQGIGCVTALRAELRDVQTQKPEIYDQYLLDRTHYFDAVVELYKDPNQPGSDDFKFREETQRSRDYLRALINGGIPEIKVGEKIKPFKGKSEFFPAGPDYGTLLVSDFTIKGLHGSLSAIFSHCGLQTYTNQRAERPLGEVGRLENGEPDGCDLHLSIDFECEETYNAKAEEIQGLMIEVTTGELATYFNLFCGNGMSHLVTCEAPIGRFDLNDPSVVDENDEAVYILLPKDLSKLAEVEFRIITLEDFTKKTGLIL